MCKDEQLSLKLLLQRRFITYFASGMTVIEILIVESPVCN